MDSFTEQIIKAKPTGKQTLAFVGAILLTVVGVFCLLFVSGSIGIAVIVVGAFLIYYFKMNQNIEYEYSFLNCDCDVDVIINKTNRKQVYELSGSDVSAVLMYNSDKFQNELEINAKLTVKNLTSGNKDNSDNWYVFMVNSGNGTTGVVLELNDKSLEHVKAAYNKTKLQLD